MRHAIVVAAALALAACKTTGTPTEVRYQTVTVVKRGPCPDPETYKKLKDGRPVPLRDQEKPASAAERVGRTAAQLGLYEAEGAWADKVGLALDRCQQEVVESPE